MANEEKITKTNALEKWASKYPKVMTWLSKLATRKTWAFQLYRYCKTVGKTPDELLALKENTKKDAEYLLDNFVAASPFTNSVTYNIASAVKSFYKYNYCSLERASGIITLEKKKPYRRHSKAELLKIYRSTQNPRDRALITFVWSTAIAKGSLTQIKWSHLEENWEKQELPHIGLLDKLIKGKGRGRYRGVEQHTFLTPEAKRDLIDYKEWLERTKGVKLKPDDPIFIDLRYGNKVKEIGFAALGQLAFVLSNRSGVPFGWHDGRRYVETYLEEIKINPNWARKIRGRKVRGEEAPYSRPAIEQLRKAYQEAVPLLEFTQPTQLMELQKRQQIVEELTSKLMSGIPLTDQDRGNMRRLRIRLGYKPKKQQRTQTNGDCENGVNCGERFEQIKEDELLTYLRNGWQIVKEINNGKEVIVRKQ